MSNNDLTGRLVELGERIDEIKTEKAELEGRKKEVSNTLKKKYGCSSIEEARALLEKKQKEVTKKTNALKKGVEELEAEIE